MSAGSYYEWYDEPVGAGAVKPYQRFRRLKPNRRQVRYGISLRRGRSYAARLLKEGKTVALIKESGRYIGRIKERLPVAKATGDIT